MRAGEGRSMNRYSSTPDLTAKQHAGGQGMGSMFLCALCAKRKVCFGRRLQRVQGLKTWVCKGCVK